MATQPPHRTLRIRSRRKRPTIHLSLEPAAMVYLHALPTSAGSVSEYVSRLVLDEACRIATVDDERPRTVCDGTTLTLRGAVHLTLMRCMVEGKFDEIEGVLERALRGVRELRGVKR